ncbi:unnamed protein product [Didymodactylos carnosus]|uniref:B box-type domain-containing protein n=1 Tax=Didymodactylos carnosus TaxID=1234261 RepID=A0A8S2JVF2_9BILA|nr:unnamed protein product [Didymodactylos carnosus]CAF3825277.1 unnamed protein product [Didymodactylos carnosus]
MTLRQLAKRPVTLRQLAKRPVTLGHGELSFGETTEIHLPGYTGPCPDPTPPGSGSTSFSEAMAAAKFPTLTKSSENIHCSKCEKGILICYGCQTKFSTKHFQEHRQQLGKEMDEVVYQHDLLQQVLVAPTPLSVTENDDKHIATIIKKIHEWERKNIQQITTVAERVRQQVQKRVNEINKVKHDFRLITDELRQSRSEDDYVEADLQQWLEKLQQLKHHIDTTTIFEISQIDVQTNDDIDWSSMVKLVKSTKAKSTKVNFDLIKTTEPQMVLDVPIAENDIRMGASNKSFLLYSNGLKELHLYDKNGLKNNVKFAIIGKIWEIIWSSYFDRYLLQGDTSFYTYDEQNHQYKLLRQIKPSLAKTRYSGCTCFEEILFIYYEGWGCRIEEWNMTDFSIRKYWKNETERRIIQMLFSIKNPNHIGVTVRDGQNIRRFELRDRDMRILKVVEIDRCSFLIPIPTTGDWLIPYWSSKVLNLINHDCTSKMIIEYNENVEQAVFLADYNCLAIATQNNQLHFYYL